MEFETSSKQESLDSDSSTERAEKKKKKSSASAAALAEIATDNIIKKQRANTAESFWQKIKGETGKREKPDLPLFGIQKPVDQSVADVLRTKQNESNPVDADTKLSVEKMDGSMADSKKMAAEFVDETITEATDAVEKTELRQAARDFAEMRLQKADGLLHELPLDERDTPQAAETAAGVALLRTMQEKLDDDPTKSAVEALDAAEIAVAQRINALPESPEVTVDDVAITHTNQEDIPAVFNAEAGSATDSVSNEAFDRPAIEGVSAEHPTFLPDVEPLIEQDGPPLQPPDFPPYGLDGMPFPYGSGGREPNGHESGLSSSTNVSNSEAIPENTIPRDVAISNERAAAGRGLIVGGVIGYFVGRRRGKHLGRAEAEKKATPTRRGLERRVNNLQETIAIKEQKIMTLAREKMSRVGRSQDRQKLVENILSPDKQSVPEKPVSNNANNLARKEVSQSDRGNSVVELSAAAVLAGAQLSVAERPTQVSPHAPGELYSRVGTSQSTSELLVNDRYRQEFNPTVGMSKSPIESPAAIKATLSEQGERPSVIPFNKKAEQFTQSELMATAEKIKVQGTSVKEMVQLGSLDERSLRRVVAEFLEGGDVSSVVSYEIKQKELKFERDPLLRQSQNGRSQSSDSGGSSSGYDDVIGDVGQSVGRDTGRALENSNNVGNRSSGPVPDSATLKAIRDKQMATVAMTTAVVASAILVLILLIR